MNRTNETFESWTMSITMYVPGQNVAGTKYVRGQNVAEPFCILMLLNISDNGYSELRSAWED